MSAGEDCEGERCVTCADEAVAMRVLEVRADGAALCADTGGSCVEVLTDLVEPVTRDDLVLVHAGVALTRLEPGARDPGGRPGGTG